MATKFIKTRADRGGLAWVRTRRRIYTCRGMYYLVADTYIRYFTLSRSGTHEVHVYACTPAGDFMASGSHLLVQMFDDQILDLMIEDLVEDAAMRDPRREKGQR